MNTPNPERLRELLARATPGPWRYARSSRGPGYVEHAHVWGPSVSISTSALPGSEPDMQLIAEGITALPALLHQLAELQERNEYLASELQLARGQVSGWKVRCNQWQEQAEAAERARDEATGLLLEWADDAEANGYAASEYPLVARTRAFLAASGTGGKRE